MTTNVSVIGRVQPESYAKTCGPRGPLFSARRREPANYDVIYDIRVQLMRPLVACNTSLARNVHVQLPLSTELAAMARVPFIGRLFW